MARKSYRSRQSITSNAGERMHNLAERDITLAALITILGLLIPDGTARGWPFAWLSPDRHVIWPAFFISFIMSLCFVIFIEIITAVLKSSEPSADRKYASTAATVNVRQNEDTATIHEYPGSDLSAFEVNIPDKPKQFKQPGRVRSAAQGGSSSNKTPAAGIGKKQNFSAVRLIILLTVLSFIMSGLSALLDNDDYDYDYDDENYEEYDWEFEEESDDDFDMQELVADGDENGPYEIPAFKTDADIILFCNMIFVKMSSGDTEWLESNLGTDVEDIAGLTVWEDLEFTGHIVKMMTSDHRSAVYSFDYQTPDGVATIRISFKFTGDDLSDENEKCSLAGMAAAIEEDGEYPYPVTAGDCTIDGRSILTF